MAEQENVVKWQIYASKAAPSEDILSNLCDNDFCCDGVKCFLAVARISSRTHIPSHPL